MLRLSCPREEAQLLHGGVLKGLGPWPSGSPRKGRLIVGRVIIAAIAHERARGEP